MNAKVKYVLSLFQQIYGLADPPDIGYGLENNARIQIRKSGTDHFRDKVSLDLSRVTMAAWKEREIPFLFDHEANPVISWKESGGAVINYDIIASAFYFLSGWQEYVSPARDEFGRFPFSSSVQRKLGVTSVPVVNYYFDILKTVVERVYEVKLGADFWDGAPFCTFVSHDIDQVDSGWKEEGFAALKQGRLLPLVQLAASRLFSTDVWFNLDEILEVERRLGVPSTFFFLARKGTYNGLPNADYDVQEARFGPLMERIHGAGSEIALHGSWGTHVSRERLQEDLDRLEKPVTGNRFHYLNFDMAKTPRVLAETGFRYDATLGFAEHYGFRNGFCFPYYLYDIERDEPTDVLEIPLVLMDGTLRHYLGADVESIPQVVSSLVSEVKKFQGCFSVLWHNNYFSPYKRRGWKEGFVAILHHCREEGATFLTGRSIVQRFASRTSRTVNEARS